MGEAKRKTVSKSPAKPPAKSRNEGLLPLSDARVTDLQQEVSELRKQVEKHHGEQRQIIVGVVVATAVAVLLVIVSVVAQVLIFNSSYKDSLDDVKGQHFQDYKDLQKSVQDSKDLLYREIIESGKSPNRL